MSIYAPWFSRDEYAERVKRVQVALAQRNLGALLVFEPESVTYLSGFFTRGYSSFQFTLIPTEGEPLLVCRDMESFYVDATAVFGDCILWSDTDDESTIMRRALSKRIKGSMVCGIELSSWQLSAQRYQRLRDSTPDVEFVDCSELVANMRLVKSPAEIDYQRRAGKAAEAGMAAAIASAAPGNSERDMAANICAAMIRAGSDLPGPGVLSSGERAFHLHGGYSDRVIGSGDHVQVETTPNVRHYHARFMRPIMSGYASDEDQEIVARLIDIQDKALGEVGPGVAATVPDHVYRAGVMGARLMESYTNKTFYSVGLLLHPNGGEALEATPKSNWSFVKGMTLHTYVLARGFGVSETIAVTETGFEQLTNFPRQLFVAK